MILMSCNNAILGMFLYFVKSVLKIIWIVGPLLAMISLIINIVMLVKNPDDKKVPAKIRNSIIALVVLFMIPTIVMAAMSLANDSTELGACWKQDVTKPDTNSTYKNPYSDTENTQSIIPDPSRYDSGKPKPTTSVGAYSNPEDIPITSCGSLEYCNRFLTIMYNNSKRLSEAIARYHPPVDYNWGASKHTWAEAIRTAEQGKLVATTCVVPASWGLTEIAGKRTVLNSVDLGGFHGYKGKITQYTKQYKFDGSMSVKTAIQKGIIQPGDIIGVKAHTFAIYSVNQKTGTAIVFDGGHKFTNDCKDYKCSPMVSYSAKGNGNMRLYQLVRWVR